jgi:hypothetical protein
MGGRAPINVPEPEAGLRKPCVTPPSLPHHHRCPPGKPLYFLASSIKERWLGRVILGCESIIYRIRFAVSSAAERDLSLNWKRGKSLVDATVL